MTDKPAFVIEAIPRDVTSVLRHEAADARARSMVVRGVDIDMAELLEEAADDIESLRAALSRARGE